MLKDIATIAIRVVIAFKTCDYEIAIDLVSFGVDTATRDGKKIADYLGNAGYNVSISSGDRRASLTIDLSNAKYLKED